jgi:hypothetical protein
MNAPPAGQAGNLPAPFGVDAATGTTKPPLTPADIAHLSPDSAEVSARYKQGKVLAVTGSVNDPGDLTETGWGALFASDADPRIKEQLQPLLQLRERQVQDQKLFKVFEGNSGVRPKETAANWAMRTGVSLVAPVEPTDGVPYYLLIVGPPARISFEFQALLDLQWAVGRLYFDDMEDYGRYAQKVVEYEDERFKPVQLKNAALWLTRNPLDIPTAMLCGAITGDFVYGARKLGATRNFGLDCFAADKATKTQLEAIWRGAIPGGSPAVVFTGSHGAEWPIADPDRQRKLQGALVTQEWSHGKPLDQTNQFSADDIPPDAKVHGMIPFLFACYGGGCPAEDNYFFHDDGSSIQVAPEPLIAMLPQALLRRGALAVIAHIDRAFAYAFENTEGTPQVQVLRDPLDRLMKGQRVAMAVDALNLQWSAYAARLGLLTDRHSTTATPSPAALTNLYIARDDARNYVVLGDPAARLRIGSLG